MRIGPLEMQRRHADEQLRLLWDELDTLGKQHEFAMGIEGAVSARAAVEIKKTAEATRRIMLAEPAQAQETAQLSVAEDKPAKTIKPKKKAKKKPPIKGKGKEKAMSASSKRGRGRPRKAQDIEAGNVIPPRTVVAPSSKSNGAAPASFAN